MYIKYNDKKYPCKCSINHNSITYKGLSENFPTEVNGEIILYADDDFELRKDDTKNYLRQIFSDGTLTLTNLPEPTFDDTTDNAPTELEQLRADVDYIAVMTGVEL